MFASVFWSLFVFDMLGDVYGIEVGGLSMLIPAIGVPVVFWISIAICSCQQSKNQERLTELITVNPLVNNRDSSLNSSFS